MSSPHSTVAFGSSRSRGSLVAAALGFALALSTGCEDEIGDACEYNVDCSSTGERLCDKSSPGGYCTIENCSAEVCPKESHCIAFYPVAFLSTPCDPLTEDLLDPDLGTDDCTPDEKCISSGYCAPKASARRFCMKKCKASDDCRDLYECRRTGIDGSEYVAPLDSTSPDKTVRFCAPRG
ncbi:MAG: hypothetical protein RBU30_19180 [Polyangia bacterium]|nr:hypothetical protein [Polyangia bacterium]